MKFESTIQGTRYIFNYLSPTSFLVSSNKDEYILYKSRCWNCADQISDQLLKSLGTTIEAHLKKLVH